LVAADDRNGDRDILRGFAAAAGGDDDLIAIGGLRAFARDGFCGCGVVSGTFGRQDGIGDKKQQKGKRDGGRSKPAARR
jgi:hypothetical protein